jgi:predicted HicB family RNase H-like nuclease
MHSIQQAKGGEAMAKVVMLRRMDDDLHKRAKIQAVTEGITLQALITKAIQEYLKKASRKWSDGK